jgi:hypothetical protein
VWRSACRAAGPAYPPPTPAASVPSPARRTQEEIYSSSYAAAAYLDSIKFDRSKKVYVIGETGILEELDLKGIPYLGGPADATKVVSLKPGEYMEHDHDVGPAGQGGGLRGGHRRARAGAGAGAGGGQGQGQGDAVLAMRGPA